MENEKEKLLENQYSRNDGKKYQVPRGMTVWVLFILLIEYTKILIGQRVSLTKACLISMVGFL